MSDNTPPPAAKDYTRSGEAFSAGNKNGTKSVSRHTPDEFVRWQQAKEDKNIRQWRCHPRLADFTASIIGIGTHGFGEIGRRGSLLIRCARSASGAEPTEPFLLDPSGEMYKPRWKDGQRVGVAWDGTQPVEPQDRLPGDDLIRPPPPRSTRPE